MRRRRSRPTAIDVVEGEHVGRASWRFEGRHADPEERHLALLDRLRPAHRCARWYSLVQFSLSGGSSRTSPTRICWRSLAPSMTTTAAGFSASISVLISSGQSWKSSRTKPDEPLVRSTILTSGFCAKAVSRPSARPLARKSPTTRTVRASVSSLDDRLRLGLDGRWRLARLRALLPCLGLDRTRFLHGRRLLVVAAARRNSRSSSAGADPAARWRGVHSAPAPRSARTAIAKPTGKQITRTQR